MSHELRTPLNVIIGYTEMLADDLGPGCHAEALARIQKSSLGLLDLIETTLSLSHMAASKDAALVARVPLPELWDEFRAEFATLPRAHGVALHWEPVSSFELRTDRRKLKAIIKNLVDNAVKFTPAGEVVVRCDQHDGVCTFTVRDTGIGIDSAHMPFIFDMFRQGDGSDVRRYGGTGLGLYIVREFIAQLGGEIQVESKPGHGSTFRASLPVGGPGCQEVRDACA